MAHALFPTRGVLVFCLHQRVCGISRSSEWVGGQSVGGPVLQAADGEAEEADVFTEDRLAASVSVPEVSWDLAE